MVRFFFLFSISLFVFCGSAFAQENILSNSVFESAEGWDLFYLEGAKGTGGVKDGAFCLDIENGTSTDWHVQFLYAGLVLEGGHTYTLGFDAFSSIPYPITAIAGQSREPFKKFSDASFQLTTEVQSFEHEVVIKQTDLHSRVGFFVGGLEDSLGNIEVCFDNVRFVDQGGPLVDICSECFGSTTN